MPKDVPYSQHMGMQMNTLYYYLLHVTSKMEHREEGNHKCGEPVSNKTLNFCAGVPTSIGPTYPLPCRGTDMKSLVLYRNSMSFRNFSISSNVIIFLCTFFNGILIFEKYFGVYCNSTRQLMTLVS